MTFANFEAIVKKHRPEVTVFKHGTYANEKTNFAVSVIFNYGQPNESRVYQYSGSYITVLNKLGIKTIEKRYIDNRRMQLAELIEENGKEVEDLFGDIYIADNTDEIKRLTEELKEYESYIIV